ncbi:MULTISPECIES: DUF4163 domain-containing protein [unclassified Paenibacillus]|uniref:PdaC/SigV domain-containing protein n=1 Tax=unclassified Paenibacillus TaxID=185978 RepID=UPI0003E281A2|nr:MULTISPECIES: DUF4163 domain-containing protein [unclassified Paenibacillus]ETT56778.1 hypothetical protein C162_00155 [Paenibacillus sp. FSL R7-269]OMF98222.1 hypothetical protein BK147_11445 [Paenibacillus sp. FSL R7-0337]
MSTNSKKYIRRWGAGMLAAGILLGGTGILNADITEAAPATVQAKAKSSSVVLKVNGKSTALTGLLQEGKVWVPVTFLRDALGMPLSYDKAGKTYTIGTGAAQTKLVLSEYGIAIKVNNYYINEYDVKQQNNRLYVPSQLINDYLGYKVDWNAAAGQLNLTKRTQNAITIKTVSYVKDHKDAPVRLDYPQVSGLASAEAEKAINDTIKQTVLKFAAESEDVISKRQKDEQPYEFEGGYVVTYNQDGVLSLVTNQYEYTGGAHGMTYRNAFTFSLKDGKRLLLGDLFGANPNYKKQLNSKLTTELKAHGGYLGGFTGLNTEKYFYLKDGKAVLFFQLYEYTVYAAGFPEFDFSFKELLPDGSSPFTALK